MGFGGNGRGAARVFADISDIDGPGNEAKDGFRAPQPLKPLVRPQFSKNPSSANGADFKAVRKNEEAPRAKPPAKRMVFGRKKFDPFAAPEKVEQMAKTLKRAAKEAAAALRRPGDATPRECDAEKWAKFWEPTQRCYYFVSSKSGESRWAAHFDDDVMVVDDDGGGVRYEHHLTRKEVTGPHEASVVEGCTIWVTLVDPVSGQAYYYSRLSGESRWSPPSWIDYYDADARCVYYVNTASNASAWDRPDGFLDEAEETGAEVDYAEPPSPATTDAAESKRDEAKDEDDDDDAAFEAKQRSPPPKAHRPGSAHVPPKHVRSPPKSNKENVAANMDKLNAILFSYQKRPKAPWDPSATAPKGKDDEDAPFASPDAKKRDSGASCPSPPDYVPTRKLRFGDTLVLADLQDLD